ncbi:MAG: Gfo/Idh/MocA family oxidoreductase, partial [Dehalococcoidia bacterium]|nr:Gfo/Idh/MocA family oxidoreductase [Dehalococcoidia bacterium]
MTNQPIYRAGIIGGGRQGTHHARGYQLHPRTEVAAVADTDPENLKLFEERFGVPGYATYEEMLA